MNGPETPSDRGGGWPGPVLTDPERTEDRAAEAAPGAGSVAATGKYTPVPPTGPASAGRGDAHDTGGTAEETGTFARPPLPDTARPEAGGTTADTPADGGDRDATTSFRSPRTSGPRMPTGHSRRPAIMATTRFPQVPGYEILEVLGVGGMGIVYKARQHRLDRLVALKMIRAGAGARPQDLSRFEVEARAVAAIDHPNIIQIYEIGEHGGLPYFSLEFLAGGSLAARIDGKPQAVAESARIVEVLARAIDVAHRRGIIHRDLKPANILLAARRHLEDRRLRPGQATGSRLGPDQHRLDPRLAELHGARAGDGRGHGRTGGRPVRAGRRSSTTCSPAGPPSGGHRSSRRSTWSATRSPFPLRSSCPACPATSRRSA